MFVWKQKIIFALVFSILLAASAFIFIYRSKSYSKEGVKDYLLISSKNSEYKQRIVIKKHTKYIDVFHRLNPSQDSHPIFVYIIQSKKKDKA